MSEMGPRQPEDEHERRRQVAKEAMARNLMDIEGISYDAAMQHVEDMFEKARRDKEAFQDDNPEEEQ